MKKNTIILLLIAVIGAAAVYYLEIKPGKPRDQEADATKPAFSFNKEDITSITLTRGSEKTDLQFENSKWVIKQPVSADADEDALNALTSDMTNVRIEREFPASEADLNTYGLTSPTVRLDVKLKNGQTHKIEFGSKEPISSAVYARIDGSQNIALLAASLLNSADKSATGFRDRSLFKENQYDFNSVKFNNSNGSFELARKGESNWVLKTPAENPADNDSVSSLLGDITAAKVVDFASETSDDSAKYGLDKPKVTFTAKLNNGGEKTISVGSKVDELYYAKVSDKPQVIKIDSALYDKLNSKTIALRSKTFFTINHDELQVIQVKNPNLTLITERDKDSKWVVREPVGSKGKEAVAFKVLDPLEAKALEILDKPSAAISGKLAKPAVVVRTTTKDGKSTVIRISAADGENAYVQIEGKPEIYKVPKSVLESMSFRLEDALMAN